MKSDKLIVGQPLRAYNSKGGIKCWQISIKLNEDNSATITTEHNKKGCKVVTKEQHITSGKNVGKVNETDCYQQAYAEAHSQWQKMYDKGYREFEKDLMDQSNEPLRPMLAHKYEDRKHSVVWPAYVQAKLDGVRCICHKKDSNTLTFTSRGNKSYDAVMHKHPKLVQELLELMPLGESWDGELYNHSWGLQRIGSAVKKYNVDTEQLQYWVFDNPTHVEDPFYIRINSVPSHLDNKLKFIHFVSTFPIGKSNNTLDDNSKIVYDYHDQFVRQGFEGLILRNKEGLYKSGFRSMNLLKVKRFQDEEFEIVDTYEEAQSINGLSYKAICFTCKTKEGSLFNCRPKGTLVDRQEMLKNRESYIGQKLTVRFFAWTDENQGKGKKVPQFPIGIAVRNYE